MRKRYWNNIEDFLDYHTAYREMNMNRERTFATRKEWDGVHYINRYGEYCILLKTGEIIVNPIEIMKMDEPDWIIVDISDEARMLINNHIKGI